MTSVEEAARSLVNEAKSRGIVVPDEADEVGQARRLLELAQEAYSNGARGEDVETIVRMGESLEVLPGPEVSEPMDHPSPPDDGPPVATQDLPSPGGETRRKEQFPIPPEIEGVPPEMPRDLTDLSDRDLRRMQGEFNAWLNRVTYLLGVEKADEVGAAHLAEQALRSAKGAVRAAAEGTKISQAEINSRAEEDEDFKAWTSRSVGHKAEMTRMTALRDIYQHNIDRLAYEWKMRQDTLRAGG